jgi:hypothetical protein
MAAELTMSYNVFTLKSYNGSVNTINVWAWYLPDPSEQFDGCTVTFRSNRLGSGGGYQYITTKTGTSNTSALYFLTAYAPTGSTYGGNIYYGTVLTTVTFICMQIYNSNAGSGPHWTWVQTYYV